MASKPLTPAEAERLRVDLGLGPSAVTNSGLVTAVLYGGTGGTTAAEARTNLGLVIGTNVQAYSANLAAWSALATSAKQNAITAGAAVADASGGATVDAEARTAINTLLARLRAQGIILT